MKKLSEILGMKPKGRNYKDKMCPECNKVLIYRHSAHCKACSNKITKTGNEYPRKKKKSKAKVEIVNFEKIKQKKRDRN